MLENSCYKVVSDTVNFNNAEEGCESIGGMLTSILDQAEMDFIYGIMTEQYVLLYANI